MAKTTSQILKEFGIDDDLEQQQAAPESPTGETGGSMSTTDILTAFGIDPEGIGTVEMQEPDTSWRERANKARIEAEARLAKERAAMEANAPAANKPDVVKPGATVTTPKPKPGGTTVNEAGFSHHSGNKPADIDAIAEADPIRQRRMDEIEQTAPFLRDEAGMPLPDPAKAMWVWEQQEAAWEEARQRAGDQQTAYGNGTAGGNSYSQLAVGNSGGPSGTPAPTVAPRNTRGEERAEAREQEEQRRREAAAAAIAPKPDSSLEPRRAPETKTAPAGQPDVRFGLGNIDLTDRNTGLYDEDGNLMTVRSMSFEENGTEILVPTVVKENGVWRELTDQEAIDWYHRTGEYLGKFKTPEEADAYAELLHEQQAEMYANVPQPEGGRNPADAEQENAGMDARAYAEQREQDARRQAAAAWDDEQKALREGPRGDAQYRQQVAENIDLADQMGLTGEQREAYLAASEEEAWKAYQHRAANDPELVSSTIASWFEKPEINDWEGRQALVDELKGLGVTYEDWVANPEDAARRQERREEVIRLLREGDAAAGNGPMDYTFEDRANSVVTGTGEAVGSSLVNAAGNVAAVAELEYDSNTVHDRGVYAHNGRTYGTGSPVDAYLDEQKVALDAAKAREREEAARIYREAHGDGSQPISERLWAMADKLGEASAEDLTRAKGGLSKFGQAGVDLSENLLEMGFDSIFGSSSLVSMAARTFGSSSRTARLDGASLGEQWAYGLSNAAVETFTEKFADGVAGVYGAGSADDIVEKVVGRLAETDAGRSFLRIAIEANGEGMEELVSGALGPLMDRIYKDESLKELYSQLDPAELVYEYMMGCAIGLVGGGASVVTGQNAAKNEELRAQDAANAQTALADEVLASAAPAPAPAEAPARPSGAGESVAVPDGGDNRVTARAEASAAEGPDGTPSLAGESRAVPDGGDRAEPVISAMTPGAQQNDATAQESAGGTDTGASPATERTGESEALNSGDNGTQSQETAEEEETEATETTAETAGGEEGQAPSEPSHAGESRSETDSGTGTPEAGTEESSGETVSTESQASQTTAESAEGAETEGETHAETGETAGEASPAPTAETATETTAETTAEAETVSTEEMAGRVATAAEQMGISLSQEEAAAAAAHVRGETDGTELSEEARAVAEEVIRRENAIAQWKAKQAVAEHAQVGAEHAETGADNGNGDNSGGIGGPPAPGGTNDLTGNGGDGGGPRLPGHTEPGRGRRSQTESHTEQSVAGALGGQQNPLYYIPTSERQTLTEAVNRVNADMNGEMQHLMDNEGWSAADIDTALTIYGLLQADGVRRGDFSAALEWGRVIQTRGTRTAQALQAFAKWTRSGRAQSQEGANQINENENLPQEMRDRITNDLMNFGEEFDNLQEGDLEGLRDLIERLSRYRGTGTFAPRNFRRLLNREMNEDYLREYALRQLIAIPADYNNRPSLGEQMKTWQVQSQLTRIGTFLRNIGGNQVFGTQDLLAQNAFGVAIDSLIGHFTGHREVRLERGWLSSRAREAAGEALRRSTLEVSGDINMRGDTNRYGTTSNRTNKMIGGPFQRFMSRWEQLLSYSLTTSDATFRGKLEGSTLESLAGEVEAGRLTQEEAEQIARERADYRLFQNHGIAYDLSKGAHDVLNRVGIGGERRGVMREGGFGLGDLVNPYPGVPANLAVKVLEYSPANIIKGGVELAQVLTAARNGELTAGQQSQAVMDIARGLSGTPAIALLAALFRTGLLKNGDDEDDPDAAAQNRAEGRSGVQWNLSATIRAGEGGSNEWKDGDNLLSVSWLEPLNAYLAIASRVADEEEDHGLAAMTSNYLEGAVQSVLDMPVMGNIANIVDTARYSTAEGVWGKVGDVAAQAAGDAVSGMLPAPVGQLARTIDPHYRDTTGDSRVDTSINTLLNSLPWARENLPQKTDVFGNPKDYASDPLQRFLNNFILPGSVNELHQTEVSARTEAVYQATGEAAVYPDRNGPRSITIEGEKIGLSAAERRSYHETAGQETERLYSEFMGSSAWANMSDAQRATIMKGLKEFANDTAKRKFAEEHGMEYSSDWDDEARMADPVSYLAARTSFKDAEKARDYDAIDEFMEGWYGLPRETRAKLTDESTVYEALLGASRKGVSSETYFQVNDAVKAQTDAAGSAKGVEKFRGFVNSGADLETMDALAESYLGSQAYDMYKAGRSSGLKPNQVLAIWEKADGSAGKAADGSISQQELYNALKNSGLTEAQKNAIWNSRGWKKSFSEYKP